jgi:uncharacterized protein (DUF1015 family)
MAHIEPFRALRYDPARVALSSVLTQPYDKITPAMQERYYTASPYSLVRIILGKHRANDSAIDNVYTRARDHFTAWREEGILAWDPEPSIYAYQQRFSPPGADGQGPVERLGFIALGRLEDYSAGVVFRHEQTLAKPKADRLELLRATKAHFGQIFMLYHDPSRAIETALGSEAPTLEVEDEYGVQNRMSRISGPGRLRLVQEYMRPQKLIIADGHHRYETALVYRNERREAEPGLKCRRSESPALAHSGLPPYEFAMMTFVNMASPGLIILPTHRLVHGLESFSIAAFRSRAQPYFEVRDVDPAIPALEAVQLLARSGQKGTAFLAVTADGVFVLERRKGLPPLEKYSPRQQKLDVVELHGRLLAGVLGISDGAIRNQRNVTYLRDPEEAMAAARSRQAQIAFLMNAVRIEEVADVALHGELLPQKSTDFYPKLLSGLTMYALE